MTATGASLASQVDTLVRLGYPAMFSLSDETFAACLGTLQARLAAGPEARPGRVPFVLVVNARCAPAASIFSLARRHGKVPVEQLHPKSWTDFTTIPQVELPGGDAYLLMDVDRGAEYLNVTPDVAQASIAKAGRSPLTIAEGIALLTHVPDILQPNNCFSLLGSRCGDKRVPALWLSRGRPKFGWCWAGNPHTWLGSASCTGRAGAVEIPVGQPRDA
jgi:hypothetical protein